MANMDTVTNVLNKKLWGKYSLTVGELVILAAGLALIYFNFLGKWSFWVAIAVILVGTMIF